MTSGDNNFNDFPKNQQTTLRGPQNVRVACQKCCRAQFPALRPRPAGSSHGAGPRAYVPWGPHKHGALGEGPACPPLRPALMCNFLLVGHCKYSSIFYHFWIIWCWIISWPWNLGYRSLTVIEIGAIQKLRYGFLFAFHSNYGNILYHLRDIVTYWQKIWNLYTHLYLMPPEGVTPSEFREDVWCWQK